MTSSSSPDRLERCEQNTQWLGIIIMAIGLATTSFGGHIHHAQVDPAPHKSSMPPYMPSPPQHHPEVPTPRDALPRHSPHAARLQVKEQLTSGDEEMVHIMFGVGVTAVGCVGYAASYVLGEYVLQKSPTLPP